MKVKVKDIEVTTRTVEQRGIVLPWQRVEQTGPITLPGGRVAFEDHPPKGTVLDEGEVFIPLDTLYALLEQERWDSQFEHAFLLDYHEGLALEAAGLAQRETRGGYHRTQALVDLLARLERQ